jgi:hypothetical protein
METKSKIGSLTVAAVGFLIGVALVGAIALAANFKEVDSLSQNYSVFITNANDAANYVYYNQTNVPYSNGLGVIVYSGSPLYASNGSTYVTPTAILTNASLTFGQAWIDVPFEADGNGNVLPASLVAGGVGTASGVTSVITFGCIPVYRRFGTNYVNSTNTALWVPSFTANGTVYTGVCTNVPSAFEQGAWGMRILYVEFASNSTPGGFTLSSMGLEYFAP